MASPNNRFSIQTRFTLWFLRSLKKLTINPHRQNRNEAVSAVSSHPSSFKEITRYRRYRNVRRAAYASMASAVGTRRAWSRAQLLRFRRGGGGGGGVRRRVVADVGDETTTGELRKLVPGGEVMDLCSLLGETAHYINCLTSQVQVMRSIADLLIST